MKQDSVENITVTKNKILKGKRICGAYILSHYMEKHDNNIELALQRYYGKCNYALIYSDKVLEG